MTTATITPLNQFFDTNGSPLNSGYLYFGAVNQDPEQFPVQMYWDESGTIPAAQPIRTISGYPSRAGSPAIIYGPDSYSLRVRNSASVQVVYAPTLGGVSSSASLAASSGSNLVGFIQTGVGAVARTSQSKMRDFVNLRDFGAVGDSVTNDTIAIQTAINSGAKKLYANPGLVFNITNTLTIDADSIEIDFQGSTLLLDDATGTKDHVFLGNGATQRGGIKLKNIVFTRQQVATGGYAVNSDLIGVCEISGCRIFGNNEIWRGIRINRGIIVNIQNNYIDNCINRGVYIIGSGTGANRTVDVSIRENRIEGGITALESSDFVEGLFCRDNIFFNTSGSGVIVDATTNANGLISFKFQDNDFDTCGSVGLFIDKVSNIQVNGCWFSSNIAEDIALKELTDGVVVEGNQFYPNTSAVTCYGNAARITGNLVSGGTTCISLNPSATRTDISSNTLSNAQFGVNLSTAANTHLVGNSIYGMSSGTITGAGGTGTVVQDNKGDSSVGGNSFITVGASPFTYTAGIRPEYVSIFSGTVSNIALGANSIGFTTNRSVVLTPNQTVTVTYSSLPYMIKNIL